MKPRRATVALFLVLGLAAPSAPDPPQSPAGHGFWLEPIPESLEEAALVEALSRSAFAGPQAVALLKVTAAYPGTVASGLAQLSAGLAFLDAGQNPEAVRALTHPDVQKTLLVDAALLGRARALLAESAEKAEAAALLSAEVNPSSPTGCAALVFAAEAAEKVPQPARAVAALERALTCKGLEPQVLLRLAEAQVARGDSRAAAIAYDRLDRDYPASSQAAEARPRRQALLALLPAEPAEARRARDIARGQALLGAGENTAAIAAFRSALELRPTGEELDLVRVRLAQALLGARRGRDAEIQLNAIGSGSKHAAEAAYHLARQTARRGGVAAYETVVARFPGTPWSEEALLQLANNEQKDARDADAVPFYRRLLKDNPRGRHVERAAWRVAFFDFRSGRYDESAALLEATARSREQTTWTSGFLYWAGRARAAQGQLDRGRALYDETVRRFKHTYHGLRAREALGLLPPRASALPVLADRTVRTDVPEPHKARIRQLLLIDRLDEAAEDIRALAPTTTVGQGTLAYIEWRRGRLRNAIIAMKKAYPDWVGEAGDRLPADVWRILYPIGYEETLAAKAGEEQLEPALVAALVCQESTFDAGAVSRAGARGLMQIMGPTGQLLARDIGVRYRRAALFDPVTSLDFGTRYLRQMLDRFDGRVERALAAYNAGPHRVDLWTAGRPDVSAEEFVESIPFSETRYYVMTILSSREQYRRLYPLGQAKGLSTGGAYP